MEIAYDPSEPTNKGPYGANKNRKVLSNPFQNVQTSATRLDEPSPVDVPGYTANQGRVPLKSPFANEVDTYGDDELEGNISLGAQNEYRPSKNNLSNRAQDQNPTRANSDFIGFEPGNATEETALVKANPFMSSVMGFASMFGGNQAKGGPVPEYDEENEPPLLEDLGIDLKLIKMRALSVLKFQKCQEEFVKEADMSGPLLLVLLFGFLLLFRGKMHFGYIYGFGVIGTLAIYFLMNLLSQHSRVKLYNTMSILGYCIFPIVVLAFFGVFLSLGGLIGFILAAGAIAWATLAATNFFEVLLNLNEQKWLIAYPICLFYVVFVIITIF